MNKNHSNDSANEKGDGKTLEHQSKPEKQNRKPPTADEMQQFSSLLMSADTRSRNAASNLQGEKSGKIGYVVLAFGSLLGMGNRLFTVPWKALKLDKENKHFMLDINIDEWPHMADATWNFTVESYYVR
ncbi:PRC-barrel domain-containing protein [Marinospirillum sp.]|uniref:PRC-barrel domain-containing protein n=1 Tax=Marinospirillum sp. TaxID=2183934 RepID=UPI0028706864|nr:PRC-barrel domain-containing protein [Marinospirillum sp.]MDR9468453.1 PRC-barrel domain-containing protein [Marinospirillum sp.]